jgi:hypothetical protein
MGRVEFRVVTNSIQYFAATLFDEFGLLSILRFPIL